MAVVLLTRARAQGERTAARLRGLGHEPILAPVLEIVATGAMVPEGPFALVLATSAQAVLGAGALPRDVGVLAVGERTADAFRMSGFHAVDVAGGDASALAAQLADRLTASDRVLYLAGHDRKPVIEERLAGLGVRVDIVEAYAARPAAAWPAPARAALAAGRASHALHYSRRSAALALAQAQASGLAQAFAALCHGCLSHDVAEPLRQAGLCVAVAARPQEAALIALLPPPAHALV